MVESRNGDNELVEGVGSNSSNSETLVGIT